MLMGVLSVHKPVLIKEVVEGLRAKEGGIFLDCTFGGGGHTQAILEAHKDNIVYGLDWDLKAIEEGKKNFASYIGKRLFLNHRNFIEINQSLFNDIKFDGILFDLGISQDQIAQQRGFSFKDTSLDMRINPSDSKVNADQVLNNYNKDKLIKILINGGLKRSIAFSVAQLIVKSRPIKSALHLASLINNSNFSYLLKKEGKIHPATVIFQAIRMHVNNEINNIELALENILKIKKSKTRLGIITFHSIEDKTVMKKLRSWRRELPPALFPNIKGKSGLGFFVSKKAILPSTEEVLKNPSARSARLRLFEFF